MTEAAAAIEETALDAKQDAPELTTETALGVFTDPPKDEWMPEKHVVKKEDGTFDLEASARKQADAYKALEKRIGTGDIPPKTHDAYEPEITIEGYALEALKADPMYQEFAEKAHAAGYTNAQMALAINEFLPRAEALARGSAQATAQDCVQALREVWTNENEYKTNINNAMRVVNAYAESTEEAKEIVQALGNNERAIRLLARIGPELEEGRSPRGEPAAMIDIESLTKSEAYWNANHPDHTATKSRVEKYYAEKYPKK